MYAFVAGELRYQPNYANPMMWNTRVVNRIGSAGVFNVSPRVWILRLHTRAFVQLRDYDLTKGLAQLGGTSGLRGFLVLAHDVVPAQAGEDDDDGHDDEDFHEGEGEPS